MSEIQTGSKAEASNPATPIRAGRGGLVGLATLTILGMGGTIHEQKNLIETQRTYIETQKENRSLLEQQIALNKIVCGINSDRATQEYEAGLSQIAAGYEGLLVRCSAETQRAIRELEAAAREDRAQFTPCSVENVLKIEAARAWVSANIPAITAEAIARCADTKGCPTDLVNSSAFQLVILSAKRKPDLRSSTLIVTSAVSPEPSH